MNKLQRSLNGMVITRYRPISWAFLLNGVPTEYAETVDEFGRNTGLKTFPKQKNYFAIGQFFEQLGLVEKEYNRRYGNKFDNRERKRMSEYIEKLNKFASNLYMKGQLN